MSREAKRNDRVDAIDAELNRILASEDFVASQQLSRFLRFIVEESLAGNAEQLKERTIARNALNRGRDFDSRLDPVVRVVAGKLRRALDRYYAKASCGALKIAVPKGGYRPVFRDNTDEELKVGSTSANANQWTSQTPPSDPMGRPVVAILPFATFDQQDQFGVLADGLAQDLCVNLSQYSWIQVIDYLVARKVQVTESDPASCATRLKADYYLTGTIRATAAGTRTTLQFARSDNGVIIWSDSFDFPRSMCLQKSLDRLARETTFLLGDLFGILSRAIRTSSMHKPLKQAMAIESLFRYFDFEMHLGDEGYDRVLQSITKITTEFPNFSLAWGALATLHLNGVAMLSKTKANDASQQALHCVKQALKADPTCAYAHWNAGLYHLMHGQQEEGISATERAVEFANGSPFEMGAAGALLTVLDEGERGKPLIDEAIKRNPALPGWIKWTTAIHQIGCGTHHDATTTSEEFTLPECFWDPLLRSVSLAGVGKNQDAKSAMERAIRLRPELAQRPQELIGRIVTNRDVKNQILEQVMSKPR